MTDYVRVIAIGGTIGALVAGSFAAPQFMSALADEALEPVERVASTIDDLFGPGTLDSDAFAKYDIVLDGTVSTEIKSSRVIKKIGHGRTSMVEIVTTPTGTYSTDGLQSPHVRYPGIEVESKDSGFSFRYAQRSSGGGYWSMLTQGSFTYITYKLATKV
jgi:hypothetical protein